MWKAEYGFQSEEEEEEALRKLSWDQNLDGYLEIVSCLRFIQKGSSNISGPHILENHRAIFAFFFF